MKETLARKNNMKLYPYYIMFAYDLLFYYAIRLMFFADVVNIPEYQIVMLSALYCLFRIIVQFPLTIVVTYIGKRNGTILGNIINIFSMIFVIFSQNFGMALFAQFLSAAAFSLKDVSEANLLTESIPESKGRADIFTRIDTKGFKWHCIFSALTSAASGFLYSVNMYLPMVLCLFMVVISTIISFNFEDIVHEKEKKEKKMTAKEYYRELKKGIKLSVNSKRLRTLLIFSGIVSGALTIFDLYKLTLMQDIGMNAGVIGAAYALFILLKGLYSSRAIKINKMFRNRTLSNILLIFAVSFIFMGIVALLNFEFVTKSVIIVLILLILSAISGMFLIVIKKYFNNFANDKILAPIYMIKSIVFNIFASVITFAGSGTLKILNIKYAIIVLGFIFLFVALVLTNYSKDKLGLDPSEYNKKDIYKA